MSEVVLKNVKKIYPNTASDTKKKKKAKKAQAAEASEGAAGAEGKAREEYHEQAE